MCLNLLVKRLFCTWARGKGALILLVRAPGVSRADGVTGDLNAFDTSSFCFSFRVVLFRVQRLSLPGSRNSVIYDSLSVCPTFCF